MTLAWRRPSPTAVDTAGHQTPAGQHRVTRRGPVADGHARSRCHPPLADTRHCLTLRASERAQCAMPDGGLKLTPTHDQRGTHLDREPDDKLSTRLGDGVLQAAGCQLGAGSEQGRTAHYAQ